MTAENTSQSADLNEETRRIWNQNASFWDERMGDGNDFQRILIAPASERLLNLQPGETVLEIACGNGVFARRMAQLGVQVIATDFSEKLLERARARISEHTDRIEYRLLDATREEQIVALGRWRFDAAVCNMAIMDMGEIDPLMRGIRQVVKPGGRFVFSLTHPSKQQYSTKGAALESLPRKGWWRVLARLTFLMPVLAHHLHALSSFSVYQDTITSSRDKLQNLVIVPCGKTGKRVASQDQFLLSYCVFNSLFRKERLSLSVAYPLITSTQGDCSP